jgi:hypothetical protein
LIEAMPRLEAETADLTKVYYQAVQRKMERDISLGRTFTSMADKIFFMCEISWEMLSSRELKINYKQIPDRIREYFGPRVTTAEEDHWRHDLLSQTMLVRDDDGYYRPAHKSLIEFFSAYKLAAAIGALKDEYVEASRKHPNVNRNLQPAEQQWSVYFRATVGGQVLAPLARFAKESTEELGKTWARVSLDDATREFIFLMCVQNTLLHHVKNQTSSDEIESRVAARALEVAAFSGDLHGADLAGAIISDCRLYHCNLSNADLSRSSWLEGSFGQVSFDHASLRGASFRSISFINVTLRNADLSDTEFEVSSSYIQIMGGIWCTSGDKEILLVVLEDGRFIAITPKTLVVQALAQPNPKDQKLSSGEFTVWLMELRDTLDLGDDLGQVSLDRNGWTMGLKPLKVGDGLKIPLTESDAMALSKDGKQVAVVSLNFNDVETASIRSGNSAQGIPLRGFQGRTHKVNTRQSAFSPTGNILAIHENQNVIGFWQTSDGECMGRVIFQTAARGCVVSGPTGLPRGFAIANSDGKDGWIVEAPDKLSH